MDPNQNDTPPVPPTPSVPPTPPVPPTPSVPPIPLASLGPLTPEEEKLLSKRRGPVLFLKFGMPIIAIVGLAAFIYFYYFFIFKYYFKVTCGY